MVSVCFYAIVIFALLPVWTFSYFPSQDGPSHLYNALLYVHYNDTPAFREFFLRQIPSAGNLAGHGLVIGFLRAGVPPNVCEKILVSISILGLALAFRFVVTTIPGAPAAAVLLVTPFLYNWPLQMGFWSFSLGVPLILVAAGLSLRHSSRWDVRSLFWLFATAGGLYICHPICWASGGLTAAVIVLALAWESLRAGIPKWRALLQVGLPLLMFVPFALPNLLFAATTQEVIWYPAHSLLQFLWPVYTVAPLVLFAGDEIPAKILFAILAIGSAAVVYRRIGQRRFDRVDILLPLVVIFLLLGLASPARIGEGTFIAIRFFLFGFLFWAVWAGASLDRQGARYLAAAVVLVGGWLMLRRLPAWEEANRNLREFVAAAAVIAPNATVCYLDLSTKTAYVTPMTHALDLISDKPIVDVRDYEAGRMAFWTRFRPGLYIDENYLSPATERNLRQALTSFEERTGEKVRYIILSGTRCTPRQLLKDVLPAGSRKYEVRRTAGEVTVFERTS